VDALRHPLLLGSLGSVLGSALLTIRYARGIEAAAHGVITHTGQIFHTATTNEYHAVLLQVMALTTNVRRHLKPVGEPHAANLSQSRVRLLRGGGVDARANAATLRAGLQRGNTALGDFALPRLAHKLVDGCHSAVGAKNLYDYLRKFNIPKYGIWSMTKNKDPDEFIKQFNGIFEKIFITTIKNEPASLPADILIKTATKNNLNYEKVKNFEDALNKVSSNKKKLIVCFGSLYGAGEILKKN